jgi:hypothetical protein
VGGWWLQCRFNVSAREGRQQDEALLKDEAETASSSWLRGKETRHDTVAWSCRMEERWHRRGERGETM